MNEEQINATTYKEWRKRLKFNYNDEGICITGCNDKNAKSIVIPSKIGTRPVVEIQKEAFKRSSCTELIVMDGVKKIGAYAFCNSEIEKVSLPADCELGTGVFSGCRRLADKEGNIIVRECYFGNINDNFKVEDKKSLDKVFVCDYPVHTSLMYLPELTYTGSRPEEPENKNLRLLKKGDTFFFGCYPQTEHAQLLPIEWIVVEKNRFTLTAAPVKYLSDVLWDCIEPQKKNEVNQWLNGIVKDVAFTEKEKEQIVSLKVTLAHMIDITEISLEYFTGDDKRNKTFVTDYVKAQQVCQAFIKYHLSDPANILMALDLTKDYHN